MKRLGTVVGLGLIGLALLLAVGVFGCLVLAIFDPVPQTTDGAVQISDWLMLSFVMGLGAAASAVAGYVIIAATDA